MKYTLQSIFSFYTYFKTNITWNQEEYYLFRKKYYRFSEKVLSFWWKSTIILGKRYLRFKQKVPTFCMKIGLFWQNLYTILYRKLAPLHTTHYLSISYSNRLFFRHNSCIYRAGHSLLKKTPKWVLQLAVFYYKTAYIISIFHLWFVSHTSTWKIRNNPV